MSRLRGFGFTFSTRTGGMRSWYVDPQGTERWVDDDSLVKPGPSLVCAGCGKAEVGIFDPICQKCRADLSRTTGADHDH